MGEKDSRLVFFDVDGVLSVPCYLGYGIGMPEKEWVQYCVDKGTETYKDCKVLSGVIDSINYFKRCGSKLFVLTAVGSSYEANAKRVFVKEKYGDVFEEFIAVGSSKQKAEMIKCVSKKYNVEIDSCLMIDDDFNLLLEMKEQGINVLHVTNILV